MEKLRIDMENQSKSVKLTNDNNEKIDNTVNLLKE